MRHCFSADPTARWTGDEAAFVTSGEDNNNAATDGKNSRDDDRRNALLLSLLILLWSIEDDINWRALYLRQRIGRDGVVVGRAAIMGQEEEERNAEATSSTVKDANRRRHHGSRSDIDESDIDEMLKRSELSTDSFELVRRVRDFGIPIAQRATTASPSD
jgi:hypothetical protein